MLSVRKHTEYLSPMLNTPKIDEQSLNDDPFARLSAQTLRTPECIDLSFVPLTNFNGIRSSNQFAFNASPTDVSSSTHSTNDNMLLDLSPRIRNQRMSSQASFSQPSSRMTVPVVSSTFLNSNCLSSTRIDSFKNQLSHSLREIEPTIRRSVITTNTTTTTTVTRPKCSSTGVETPLSTSTQFTTTSEQSPNQFLNCYMGDTSQPTSASAYDNCDDKTEKYIEFRLKNNLASKKFRTSKRNNQKEMEAMVEKYLEVNKKYYKRIDRMEKQIQFYKSVLFKNFKKRD